MSTPTALSAEYRKVIPARFVTQRSGKPMHCVTCGTALVMGQAFAATPGDGWHSYCADCAESFPFQVRGLVTKLTAMNVVIPEPMTALVIAFLTNENTATALAAKAALMTLRAVEGKAAAEASSIDISSLSGRYTVGDVTVKVDTLTSGKWSGWSFVKDAQGGKLGAQRPGQRYDGPAVDLLRTVLQDIADAATPLTTTVPEGYYATVSATGNNDLDFWRVSAVTTGGVQVQRVIGGHPDTAVRRVTAVAALAAIDAATPYLAGLTYATEIGRCMKCNRHLTDEGSRAIGLGPDCAAG